MCKEILRGVVERIGDERVKCTVNFGGVPVLIAFKRETMDPHNMEVGDVFSWDRPSGRRSIPEDITPIHFEDSLTPAEEKRLIDFVNEGTVSRKQ